VIISLQNFVLLFFSEQLKLFN